MSQPLSASLGERYRLEQLLGQGGMGSVYRAYDRLTGQHVALKLVPMEEQGEQLRNGRRASLGDAPTMALSLQGVTDANEAVTSGTARLSLLDVTMAAELQTLQTMRISDTGAPHISVGLPKSSSHAMWARVALAQEFRTLASLRHPHIISVLDYGFVGRSQPFFTMELLENAEKLSTASKGLSLEAKALLLVQLLRALSYLHRRAILHRDLKPANVMVIEKSGGNHVKLLDFGLALARSHVQPKSGEITGTISYMAPELFQEQPPTEAADVFAVGVMAYELFCQRHPFEHEEDRRVISAILHKEPSWEPLKEQPAVAALLRGLLAKSPTARPSVDEALNALVKMGMAPPLQETVALRESTLQAARFVGREHLLETLRDGLTAAQAGSGEVRLLAGESGVGKSRLMEELRVHALVQGVLSVRGQAVSEGGGAYGIWREILRTLTLCTKLEELDASVLKAILPDLESLLERAIPNAPALNPQAAQLRLVKVIESLLLRQSEPLLILLEDLHWADAESLMLLRRLGPSLKTRPIMILASYRDDEAPNLPQALPGCTLLKLGRLSASHITELCQAMLGDKACTPELVSFLESETEGNVLFIIEVTRALAEEAGQLSLIPSHGLPKHVLTGGIQAIVQRRLARLPEDARPLLRLAAVSGRQLDLSILRHFEPHIEPWLYMAAAAAVLEVHDQIWRFAHDKIRESLLHELTPREKQRLHLALAEAIESTYSGSAPHAALLAEHYQRGGRPAKAALYQVGAGVYALQQGATERAATLLAQALSGEAKALLPKVQAARAYNCLIQAQVALGLFRTAMESYEDLLAYVGLPAPQGVASIAAEGSALLWRRLRSQPIAPMTTAEERQLWSEIAHATRWAGETYVWVGQPLKSIGVAFRGTELASVLGDTGLLVHYLAGFGYLAGLVPLPPLSQMFLDWAARLLEGLASSRVALDFGRFASVRHLNAADWDLAKTQLAALIDLSRQVGDEQSLMFGLSFSLICAFRLGENDIFDARGPELLERGLRNQSSQFARTYPLYQGIKALRSGDLELARRLLSEADGHVQKAQDAFGKILIGGPIALLHLQQGEKAQALARAEETLKLAEVAGFSSDVVVEGVAAVVEVYLTVLETEPAKEQQLAPLLRRSLSAMRRCARTFPWIRPRTLLWHSRAAWHKGAARLARYLAEKSASKAQQLKIPYDEALARIWRQRYTENPSRATADFTTEMRGIVALLLNGR